MPIKNNIARQKSVITIIIVLSSLFLLVVNLASWMFLFKIKDSIDREFGQRLLLAGRNVELRLNKSELRAMLAESDQLAGLLVQQELATIKTELDLERAYIIDSLGVIAACTDEKMRGDNLKNYVFIEQPVLDQVWTGRPMVSPLYEVKTNYFKTAFLPLTDQLDNPVGILCVEANARFLETIRTFKRGLIIGSTVSVGVVAVIFIFLFMSVSIFIKLQGSLARAERLALLGQMASHIAHEIRNPLGIIKSTSDLIKRRYQDPQKPDELFQYINDEVRRLNDLINHFLMFAREKELEKKENNLPELVNEIIMAVRPECDKKQIKIVNRSMENIGDFPFDRDAVKQVLLNLLLNAQDAIQGPGTITVGLEKKDLKGTPHAVVSIQDTGAGIARENLDKIFQPFFSTKTTGSGLGLAISQRIAEQHQGQLQAASQTGHGTIFTLSLPLKS